MLCLKGHSVKKVFLVFTDDFFLRVDRKKIRFSPVRHFFDLLTLIEYAKSVGNEKSSGKEKVIFFDPMQSRWESIFQIRQHQYVL